MKHIQNLTMVKKLVVIAAIFLAGQMICGAFALWGLYGLSQRTERIYQDNLLPIAQLGDMRALNYKMIALNMAHIQAYDSSAIKKAEEDIAAGDKDMDELIPKYEAVIVTDSERTTFARYKESWVKFKAIREKMLNLSRLFSKDGASELRAKELLPVRDALLDDINTLIEENRKQAGDSYQISQDVAQKMTMVMIGAVLLMALIGLVGVWRIAAMITGNLSDVLEAAKGISAGNLAKRSSVVAKDEVGQLAEAFNLMAGSLEQSSERTKQALETQAAEIAGVTNAISKAQAVIEFNLDGTVVTANENFLQCLGYRLDEIKGQHHRMFCQPAYRSSSEYQAFWQKLNRGEYDAGVYPRMRKDGKEIWIQASYNPILDTQGKPYKIVKYATDITAQKLAALESEGILQAINRGQAAIEFNLDGTVRTANPIFLSAMGYSLSEIQGQHHRLFCEPVYASSSEYQALWQKLNRGEFEAGVYRRLAKGGKEVWIQATYNPIFDASGKPYKVVKFATDITAQKQAAAEMERLVGEAQGVLGQLAQNDLTQEMQGSYQGDLEKIKSSINAVVHNLAQTMTAVRAAVEAVSSGAEEITKGNEDLSQRTSEQASALEETSASMEEMTSTVKQNADNAKQANQLASAARDTADKGGAVTKKAVDAMGEINKSSKKIADIITVIDEIAFQTNLLALNAAVEAARAGEHGRGFAVVAAEVRNLAQRSATAAKEIKGLINESIQRVNDGSELVDQSGKTLHEIVSSVKRVSDIIAEITAASQEQASGIDQVNKAIMSMDETTQQNAALVEETTSASQSMKEQAKELMRQIAVFKVDGAGRAGMAGMARPMAHAAPHMLGSKAPMKKAGGKPESKMPVAVASGNSGHRAATGDEFEEF